MEFIFFGTPKFAAIVLEKLIAAGFIPAAVVCNPDRPVGRKQIITSPPTKLLAQKYNIPVFQPEALSSSKFEILNSKSDFAIVAAYYKIIPKQIIDSFKLGIIGVHPSLLPKYRGPSPIQTAILAGAEETGTTLFMLDEKIDHGKTIASSKMQIANSDNFEGLLEKLAELSGELLIKTLPDFVDRKIKPEIQNETKATYTKKFKTEDGLVDLEKDEPKFIARKIMALNPEPGVYTFKNGKRLKLLEVEKKDGALVVIKTQWEGKRPQSDKLDLPL